MFLSLVAFAREPMTLRSNASHSRHRWRNNKTTVQCVTTKNSLAKKKQFNDKHLPDHNCAQAQIATTPVA